MVAAFETAIQAHWNLSSKAQWIQNRSVQVSARSEDLHKSPDQSLAKLFIKSFRENWSTQLRT